MLFSRDSSPYSRGPSPSLLSLGAILLVSISCGRFDAQPPAPASEIDRTSAPLASGEAAMLAGSSKVASVASMKPTNTPVDAATPFAPKKIVGGGKAMGTSVDLAAFTTKELGDAEVEKALRDAFAEIQRVETLMTTWRPDSVLSIVNANAGKKPVTVDDETFRVVEESKRMNQRSSGTFDITFETMHGLWKFDEDLDKHPPSDAAIREVLPFVGSKHIVLDAKAKTIFLDQPRTKISLGGIAKGYGVDQAAKVLDQRGLTSFYIKAGGDLFARGKKPDGSEWSAGIRDPRGVRDEFFAILPLSDHAFSTAGDYERSYVLDGTRYHHILDPRTGKPATACRSVTIWAPSALIADGIDDAVFILGPEKGLALVEATEGVGAVIVDAKNKVWVSKRLEGKLVVTKQPTDGI